MLASIHSAAREMAIPRRFGSSSTYYVKNSTYLSPLMTLAHRRSTGILALADTPIGFRAFDGAKSCALNFLRLPTGSDATDAEPDAC